MDIIDFSAWLAKILIYSATAGVIGGYFICRLCQFNEVVSSWMQRYLTVAALLGVAAVILAFANQLLMFSGRGLASFYDWEIYGMLFWGEPALSWGLALCGFISCVIATMRCWRNSLFTWFMLLGGAAILLSFAFTGHMGRTPWYGKSALLLHVLAISLWMGSLLPLWQLSKVANPPLLAHVMHSFGKYALVFVGLLLVMGFVMLLMLLGDLRLLWQTTYGLTMLVKLGLVALLLGLGATNKLLLVPKLAKPGVVKRLRMVISIEMMIGVLVFGTTAWVTVIVGLDVS